MNSAQPWRRGRGHVEPEILATVAVIVVMTMMMAAVLCVCGSGGNSNTHDNKGDHEKQTASDPGHEILLNLLVVV